MKGKLIFLGSGLLMASLAVAQDAPAPSTQEQDSATSQTQTTQSSQTTNNVIRGCLSGSAGNYTITDQNGTQYSVSGTENQLAASVGHEVELTTRQDVSNQSTAQGGQTTASTTNAVQVSNLRDIASTCKAGHSMNTAPMKDESNPQMAMLQQQESMPGSASPQQTTPPVTSQTPTTPGASTSSTQQNAQQGATSSTTTSNTTPTTTQQPTAATPDTSAAPTSPSATTPDATTATPGSGTQQPQANSNSDDQNKPLYERPATDIPGSGASTPSQQNPH